MLRRFSRTALTVYLRRLYCASSSVPNWRSGKGLGFFAQVAYWFSGNWGGTAFGLCLVKFGVGWARECGATHGSGNVRELRRLIEAVGLRFVCAQACVYYPPAPFVADFLGPMDRAFSHLGQFGAAFVALKARKP